jgi:hypothetical protein
MDTKIEPEKAIGSSNASDKMAAAQLDDNEMELIKKQIDLPTDTSGYFALYRFCDTFDILILYVSVLAAIAAGAASPLMTVRTTPPPYNNRD